MESSWEIRTRRLLRKLWVKFKQEFTPLVDKKYRVDFVLKISDDRIVWIEIDWHEKHFTFFGRIYDKIRDYRILKWSGIKKIYRVKYKNLEKTIKRIVKYERIRANILRVLTLIVLSYILYSLIPFLREYYNYVK